MLATYGLPAARAPMKREMAQAAQAATMLPPMMVAPPSTTDTPQAPATKYMHLQQHPTTKLDLASQQLIGVARWPDPAHNEETAPHQQRYGKRFSDASMRLGGNIANRQIKSMESLWNNCRNWRVAIAQNAGDQKTADFRIDRRNHQNEIATPIHKRYAYMLRRTIESISAHQRHPNVAIEMLRNPSEPELVIKRLWMTIELEGKTARLTEMRLGINKNTGEPAPARAGRVLGDANGVMVHTDATLLAPLLKLADNVFQNTLRPGLNRNQRMQGLAEIHWLLTQACPDKRGSAAKAELAVRAMAHAMDMELPPLRRGIQADLEAFVLPKDVFIAKYADFLEA